MKILHLSDLHFGKIMNNLSLIEGGDQDYLTDEILRIAGEKKPDAVIISGDVYDRGVPPKEAVTLLSRLLTGLAGELNLPTMMIAGNHDGGERLEFASGLLQNSNLYIAGTAETEMQHHTVTADGEEVTFWLMPYVFPGKVRDLFGLSNEEVPDYDAAARILLEKQNIDFSARNVILAHQYVVADGESVCFSDSETAIGGVGAIDFSVFDGFDYVALGHIHKEQHVGRESVRYAGTPMPYHFSEIGEAKGALLVTVGAKGSEPQYEKCVIEPLHKMRTVSGRFNEILESEVSNAGNNEYIAVTLTDSEPVYDADNQLRALYSSKGSRLLDISFAPERSGSFDSRLTHTGDNKSMTELFEDFFSARNGRVMDEEERKLIELLAERIGSEGDIGKEDLAELLVREALNRVSEE